MKVQRIESQVVSRKLAEELRRAGLDRVECVAYYSYTRKEVTYIRATHNCEQEEKFLLLPTYSSVCKWLEKKHKILVYIEKSMWYLTREMTISDKPETLTFQEDVSYGMLNGTVVFIESKR